MYKQKKFIFTERQVRDFTKRQFLDEIAIDKKYEIERTKGKTHLDYQTYKAICEIDPTTKNEQAGKYCNWLLQHVNNDVLHDREKIQNLHIALEQFHDGLKRGILKQNNINSDIGSYKTVDELITTIQGLMQQGTQLSQSEHNYREKLKGQFKIVGESPNWYVVNPLTFEAERYFGAHSKWCTVGNDSYFKSYTKKGPLYITLPKNGDIKLKMQFHFETNSFADVQDKVFDNPKKCILSVVGDDNSFDEIINMWSDITPKFNKYKFISFKDAMQLLSNGEDINNIFETTVDLPLEGNYLVSLNGQYNIVDINRGQVIGKWVDKDGDLLKVFTNEDSKCKIVCEGNRYVDISEISNNKNLKPIGILYPYFDSYRILTLDEFSNKIWSNNINHTLLKQQVEYKGGNFTTVLFSKSEDGLKNSLEISKTTNGEDNAVNACLNYKKGGLQWYLGSLGEMYFIYLYLTEINNILNHLSSVGYNVTTVGGRYNYWSSSEYDYHWAWYVWTDDGDVNGSYKDWGRRVRPVAAPSAL